MLGDDKITIRHSILLPAVSEARPQEAIGRSTTQGIFCVRGAIWWKVNLLVLARQLWPKWPKRGGRQTAFSWVLKGHFTAPCQAQPEDTVNIPEHFECLTGARPKGRFVSAAAPMWNPHTALTTNSLAAAFQQPQPCLPGREPAKFRNGTYTFGRVKHDGPDQSGALGLYRRELDEDQN